MVAQATQEKYNKYKEKKYWQDKHRTLPLSPQRGAQKLKTAVFRVKSHFAYRKYATMFLCVKIVSRCNAIFWDGRIAPARVAMMTAPPGEWRADRIDKRHFPFVSVRDSSESFNFTATPLSL